MNGQEVLDLLKQEASLCAELAALRSRQRALIDAGQAEQLLEVLAAKQRTISGITAVEEHLRPLKTDWQTRRADFPTAQRIAITDAFRGVREQLEDLITKETEDAEALAAQKDSAAREMESFDRKRRLETVYRQPEAAAESRYLDRKDA